MKVEERERGREEALHVYLVQDHPFRHVAPVRGRVYVIGNLGSRVCVIDRRVSPAYLRRCCTVLRAQSRVASWRRKWLRHEKVSRIRGARRNTFPLKRKKKKKNTHNGGIETRSHCFAPLWKRSLVSSAVLNDSDSFFFSLNEIEIFGRDRLESSRDRGSTFLFNEYEWEFCMIISR